MKKEMHQNSLESHRDNLKKKTYSNQINNILNCLDRIKSGTMHEIAEFLSVPLNTISGRFKVMREEGLIKGIGTTEKRRTIWKSELGDDQVGRIYSEIMIEELNKVDENKIEQCIELLTGMNPLEKITDERYELKLGKENPLELGYNKRRNELSIESMSYSAKVRMLQEICEMMKNEAEFLTWISLNCA